MEETQEWEGAAMMMSSGRKNWNTYTIFKVVQLGLSSEKGVHVARPAGRGPGHVGEVVQLGRPCFWLRHVVKLEKLDRLLEPRSMG